MYSYRCARFVRFSDLLRECFVLDYIATMHAGNQLGSHPAISRHVCCTTRLPELTVQRWAGRDGRQQTSPSCSILFTVWAVAISDGCRVRDAGGSAGDCVEMPCKHSWTHRLNTGRRARGRVATVRHPLCWLGLVCELSSLLLFCLAALLCCSALLFSREEHELPTNAPGGLSSFRNRDFLDYNLPSIAYSVLSRALQNSRQNSNDQTLMLPKLDYYFSPTPVSAFQ